MNGLHIRWMWIDFRFGIFRLHVLFQLISNLHLVLLCKSCPLFLCLSLLLIIFQTLSSRSLLILPFTSPAANKCSLPCRPTRKVFPFIPHTWRPVLPARTHALASKRTDTRKWPNAHTSAEKTIGGLQRESPFGKNIFSRAKKIVPFLDRSCN